MIVNGFEFGQFDRDRIREGATHYFHSHALLEVKEYYRNLGKGCEFYHVRAMEWVADIWRACLNALPIPPRILAMVNNPQTAGANPAGKEPEMAEETPKQTYDYYSEVVVLEYPDKSVEDQRPVVLCKIADVIVPFGTNFREWMLSKNEKLHGKNPALIAFRLFGGTSL
jgi:hypothetical protein